MLIITGIIITLTIINENINSAPNALQHVWYINKTHINNGKHREVNARVKCIQGSSVSNHLDNYEYTWFVYSCILSGSLFEPTLPVTISVVVGAGVVVGAAVVVGAGVVVLVAGSGVVDAVVVVGIGVVVVRTGRVTVST